MGTCLNCTPTREGVSGVSSALTCAAKALAREPLCSPPRCMPLRFSSPHAFYTARTAATSNPSACTHAACCLHKSTHICLRAQSIKLACMRVTSQALCPVLPACHL